MNSANFSDEVGYRKDLEKLKEEKSSTPDDALLPILTEFAKLKGIDIGKSATAKGVFDKISAAKNS